MRFYMHFQLSPFKVQQYIYAIMVHAHATKTFGTVDMSPLIQSLKADTCDSHVHTHILSNVHRRR